MGIGCAGVNVVCPLLLEEILLTTDGSAANVSLLGPSAHKWNRPGPQARGFADHFEEYLKRMSEVRPITA